MKKATIILAVVIALAVSACGTTETADQTMPDPSALSNTTWDLVRIVVDGNVIPLAAATKPTISFTDEGISGSTGCNGFNTTVDLSDDGFSTGDITQTLIGCPPDIDAQETAIMTVLGAADTWTLEGGSLTIGASNGSGSLEFTAPVDTPTLPIEGVTWKLTTLVDGAAASTVINDASSTLTISNGEANGTSGCNSFFATVDFDDQGIKFSDMGWTEIGCRPEVMEQEAFIFAVLGQATAYAIDGTTLTVTSPVGDLIYDGG